MGLVPHPVKLVGRVKKVRDLASVECVDLFVHEDETLQHLRWKPSDQRFELGMAETKLFGSMSSLVLFGTAR
jgi:hypothetical protein